MTRGPVLTGCGLVCRGQDEIRSASLRFAALSCSATLRPALRRTLPRTPLGPPRPLTRLGADSTLPCRSLLRRQRALGRLGREERAEREPGRTRRRRRHADAGYFAYFARERCPWSVRRRVSRCMRCAWCSRRGGGARRAVGLCPHMPMSP